MRHACKVSPVVSLSYNPDNLLLHASVAITTASGPVNGGGGGASSPSEVVVIDDSSDEEQPREEQQRGKQGSKARGWHGSLYFAGADALPAEPEREAVLLLRLCWQTRWSPVERTEPDQQFSYNGTILLGLATRASLRCTRRKSGRSRPSRQATARQEAEDRRHQAQRRHAGAPSRCVPWSITNPQSPTPHVGVLRVARR